MNSKSSVLKSCEHVAGAHHSLRTQRDVFASHASCEADWPLAITWPSLKMARLETPAWAG